MIDQQGRAFTHGFEIHLEKATLQFEFAVIDGQPVSLLPLTVYTSDGQVVRPELGDGDPVRAFEAEIAEVADSIEAGRPSPILSGQLARDAIVLCQKQAASVVGRNEVEVGM